MIHILSYSARRWTPWQSLFLGIAQQLRYCCGRSWYAMERWTTGSCKRVETKDNRRRRKKDPEWRCNVYNESERTETVCNDGVGEGPVTARGTRRACVGSWKTPQRSGGL
ncbi:unnamed protein product [Cuscuta campestris]|uniref:Uncharacterized protein n=1 Tax=Cuscuta campestris TaxID=132261 RepID=A0A484NK39_9ASTE|nr:unnamed protein product [Cuscuta campestris]